MVKVLDLKGVWNNLKQFEGVEKTVNGEIDVFEMLPGGGITQITDLDRLEESVARVFQIAEHKTTQKESILEPKELDEVINTFFRRGSTTELFSIKEGATRQDVIDTINSQITDKNKKDFQKAGKKYIQSIVNKAKVISLANQEKETGITIINFTVSGRYTGTTTEDNPESLKRMVAEVKVLVFRIVDKIEQNRLMARARAYSKNDGVIFGVSSGRN